MKNKRILYLITAGMIAISTVGCGSTTDKGSESGNSTEISSELDTENDAGKDTEKETESESEKETEKDSEQKPEENSEQNSEQKPTYTYSDINKKMYAKKDVSVKDLPNSDGKDVGVIKENEEVNITGQCKETNWYRINFNGATAYVNFEFLIDEKPVEPNKPVEPEKPVHTCSYDSLKSDSNNHWYACSCGKTSGKGAHNYDNNSDASCNTCGFTRTVHTCNYSTLKTDASNHWYVCSCGATSGKGAHNYDNDADATCNTCGYTREVKPVEPSVPGSSVNWNGGDIYLDNVGIKIPTLTEFNKTGISSTDNNWWWTGHENDNQALSSMNRIYLTCDEFHEGLVAQGFSDDSSNGFSVSRNRIWWSWSGGDKEHFALSRHDGYYVLTINQSLKSHDFFGIDVAPWNRDIVKTMLSFITSEVNTVYSAILEDLIGTEQFDGSWKTVGDCKVMFDYNSSYNGHYVYKIKGK